LWNEEKEFETCSQTVFGNTYFSILIYALPNTVWE